MEFLRIKTGILLSLLFLFSVASAQVYPSKVFENSYKMEASGDYAGAINALTSLYGHDYHKNSRLGWLYYLDKKYDLSEKHYNIAISSRPKAVEPLLGLCYPLEVLQKTDQLETVYKKILSIDPSNSKINYALGNIYYYRKNFTLAEKYFDKGLEMYPYNYYFTLMSAWTKYFLGKKTEAKNLFNTVLIISPDDSSAKEGLRLK